MTLKYLVVAPRVDHWAPGFFLSPLVFINFIYLGVYRTIFAAFFAFSANKPKQSNYNDPVISMVMINKNGVIPRIFTALTKHSFRLFRVVLSWLSRS